MVYVDAGLKPLPSRAAPEPGSRRPDRGAAGAAAGAASGGPRLVVAPLSVGIPEVKLVQVPRFADERGFFSEVHNAAALAAAGIDLVFVQDNHSLSRRVGTIRGLHYQAPPFAQDKLVRVCRGAVLDVAVDIRHGSPTFGCATWTVLSAENWRQLLIPAGFAHAFCTLEPDTEVLYKVTAPYSAAHDHGIRWDDPALDIDWPVALCDAIVSDKDRRWPCLADAPGHFTYAGQGARP